MQVEGDFSKKLTGQQQEALPVKLLYYYENYSLGAAGRFFLLRLSATIEVK